MAHNIKSIRQEFKRKGVFYTTSELATYMKSLVDIDTDEVYDPTCGDGALLAVFGDDVKKYGQEIDERQIEEARRRLVNFTGVCGDTLTTPAFYGMRFRCIVANPPFSVAWEPSQLGGIFNDERFASIPAMPPKSKADYAFLLHILHYLADDGIAVTLNFPGVLYRGNSEGALRKWLVDRNVIDKVIRVPGKTFIDTTIETSVIVFRKNKASTSIEFVDGEKGKSASVSAFEIAKNNYVLSVGSYVVEVQAVKEKVDMLALQRQARKGMMARLKADIVFDRMVCDIEGWDHDEYLDDLMAMIDLRKQKGRRE